MYKRQSFYLFSNFYIHLVPIIKETIMKTTQIVKNQNVWIGHTKFKPSFTHKMMQQLLHILNDQDFCSSCWNAWSNGKKTHLIPIVFSNIEKTQFQAIFIDSILTIQMLRSLVLPAYNNLLFLNIKNSKLQNIEFLNYFNTEYLTTLNLESNQITLIKSINKLKWKNLGFISFSDNPICSINLSRVKTHIELKQLKLQEKIDHHVVGNDMSFLSKLKAVKRLNEKKTNLLIVGQGRVAQKKLMEIIAKKVPCLQIRDFKSVQQSVQPAQPAVVRIYIQEMEIEEN